MTAEQFTYWLQGFMEMANPESLDTTQTQIIKDHLKLVFDKQTPDRAPRLFDPSTWKSPNNWPPLAPMPTTPYPVWQEPHRVICETPPSTCNGENPIERKFC